MQRTLRALALSVTVGVLAVPAIARAEGYVSPFIGPNFGNNSGDGRTNFGVDFGWMGKGIAGGELDFGYAPNFFGSPGGFGDNHVLTAMANLIVGVPVGGSHEAGWRPYGTLGFGLVRTQVTGGVNGLEKINDNNGGLNAGAGLMGYFSEHAGLRGDVRYFRTFAEAPKDTLQFGAFHFWRGTVGVLLRW